MPKVMTANLLHSGDVVYLANGARWVRDIGEANVASDAAGMARLEAEAAEAVKRQEVISTYLFDVITEGGRPAPKSMREKIRAAHGPTV
jgi:hypothetical protein